MKEAIKKYSTELLLAFGFSFMMYFYEPLLLYYSNIYDFWFDIYLYFKYVVLLFVVMFIITFILLMIFRLLFKEKVSKEISFSVFIFSYIQGNVLISGLAPIDGFNLIPDKTEFYLGSIASLLLFTSVFLIVNYIFRKRKIKAINKIIKYSVIVIAIMLTTAILSFAFKKDMFVRKENVYATSRNLNTYSNQKNFIVLVVDSVDSKRFDSLLKNKSILNDFTYYPDTLSAYPYTRYSIPLILTGKSYKNEESFVDFYTKSINESALVNKLKNDKYLINVYTPEVLYNDKDYSVIDNLNKANSLNFINLIIVQTKYSYYKYAPYSLKILNNITRLNYNDLKPNDNYVTNNKLFYDGMDDVKKIDDNVYKLIHIDGAHWPYSYGDGMKPVNGTYDDAIKASATIIEKYLKTLKENNLYDNSVIVILADHGRLTDGDLKMRTNPILYIKGLNEIHEYNVSQDKVSYMNLDSAFIELLSGSDGKNLFNKNDNFEREVYLYEFNNDKELFEWKQPSNAWDFESLYQSGKTFRKK